MSLAPYVFTKLLKLVVELLRSNGFKSVVYLDDFLLISSSMQECELNLKVTMNLLCSLGFMINKQKCQLIPAQTCTFLGFVVDSHEYSIYLTSKKREKILKLTTWLYKKNSCKIRVVAQVIGTLISAYQSTRYGWLYTRFLERGKY